MNIKYFSTLEEAYIFKGVKEQEECHAFILDNYQPYGQLPSFPIRVQYYPKSENDKESTCIQFGTCMFVTKIAFLTIAIIGIILGFFYIFFIISLFIISIPYAIITYAQELFNLWLHERFLPFILLAKLTAYSLSIIGLFTICKFAILSIIYRKPLRLLILKTLIPCILIYYTIAAVMGIRLFFQDWH